jgi:hypothetical protein
MMTNSDQGVASTQLSPESWVVVQFEAPALALGPARALAPLRRA